MPPWGGFYLLLLTSMSKLSDYTQAQAEAHASDPSWPDRSEFDQNFLEHPALMQGTPIPSPSEQ